MRDDDFVAALTDEQIDHLRRRMDARPRRSGDVDDLAGTQERMGHAATANTVARGAAPTAGASLPSSAEVPVVLGLPASLPTYLGTVLSKAESALVQRDLAARRGDDPGALHWEECVAELVCLGLERAMDEFDEVAAGDVLADHDLSQHRSMLMGNSADRRGGLSEFREQEEALLRLIGLSQELASRHCGDALRHFQAAPAANDARSVDDLMSTFQEAYIAVDRLHKELLTERVRTEERVAVQAEEVQRRARKRRRLRAALTALGGVTIVVANTAAIPVIGPLAVPSILLGNGATGAVADLIKG